VQSGGGGNTAPTVDAGVDQTITLPTNQAQLAGTISDADGDTLTSTWSAQPNTVTFTDAAAASTTATFPAEGTYTLTLTANDGATTGSDSLTVIVLAAGAELFWPAPDTDETVADRGWIRVAPADVGMDAAKLAEAQAYAETAGGAGMVVKGGRLVHSWAVGTDPSGRPFDIDSRWSAQSATKSIGGIVFGLAYDRNLFELADAAITHLPGLGNPPGTDTPDRLGAITVQQLATHTAGFPKDGGYLALEFDPGSIWSYSDGGLNWLADLLTNVLQEDLHAVITREVWTDLGLNNGSPTNTDDVLWRANEKRPQQPPVGSPAIPHRELASGMSINANAMARVGLLFLRNGMWSTRRILSEEFVQISRTTTGIDLLPINKEAEYPGATANYGVLWWTNSACALTNVPSDAYWAWGQYDSLIVVIPSLDLVVSRIGPSHPAQAGQRVFGEGNWTAEYGVLAPFLDPIVAATGNTAACTPR
jgi:CubicO group peptidase (beta-lactamase class C family)